MKKKQIHTKKIDFKYAIFNGTGGITGGDFAIIGLDVSLAKGRTPVTFYLK
ncbi:hypothetical protein ACU8V7_23670 [Zobellia nedashkovskayae]